MIFDPLHAASLLILAASPENLCIMDKPTEIEVIPSAQEIVYDYSRSLADIQGTEIDTIDPHSFDGISVMQGYTQGGLQLEPSVKMAYKTYEGYGISCVWYEKITIKIELDPTIVIAKEVQQDPCMGRAVRDHEHEHVRVDRRVVNKYSRIMGNEVNEELAKRGFMAGPIKTEQVPAVADRMQKTVFQIVEHEAKKMDLEREELQREIDSKAEYERVGAACPDFNPLQPKQTGSK